MDFFLEFNSRFEIDLEVLRVLYKSSASTIFNFLLILTFFVVACTCNPATLETEFRNGVGSIPVGGNSSSIGGWIV